MRGYLIVLACLIVSCCSPDIRDPSAQNSNSPAIADGAANNSAGTQSGPAATTSTAPASTEARSGRNACLMQEGEVLDIQSIRATGTEPFWSAQVEGRCVTYMTPENQSGVRVWTKLSQGAGDNRVWLGQLNGKKFEMRVRAEAGCSDGMSDDRYPLAVELSVDDEIRKGCAKPL